MSPDRKQQLTARRNRLNDLGDYPIGIFEYNGYAQDYSPRNNSEWNRKRIRIRNKLNAMLRPSVK